MMEHLGTRSATMNSFWKLYIESSSTTSASLFDMRSLSDGNQIQNGVVDSYRPIKEHVFSLPLAIYLGSISSSMAMKTEQQVNKFVIDPNNLDDWLESDLRQSGILPSDNSKTLYNNLIVKKEEEQVDNCGKQSFSVGCDDKTMVGDLEVDQNFKPNLPSPPTIAPILQILATLTSIQQQQQQQRSILPQNSYPTPLPRPPTPPLTLTPDAINPSYINKTPVAPIDMSQRINSKKRPLEPSGIHTPPESLDPVALKRMKNTDAARRSRLRKVMKMEGLESRINELEKQNEQLILQVAEMEKQRDLAKMKESSQGEKVLALETELAQARKLLVSRASSGH
ncbi:hypothetical protein BC941DRAFT_133656 [Chlamydoabsidia padenii]|nr:hypothetical protein BC941DRAFT_133656 [Chlamydoabsidia padenii]